MHPTAELFTEKAWAAIVAAQQLAQQRRQQQMESEHLFAALLSQQGLASRVLEKAGVDVGTLSQRIDAHIEGQPSLSSPPRTSTSARVSTPSLIKPTRSKGPTATATSPSSIFCWPWRRMIAAENSCSRRPAPMPPSSKTPFRRFADPKK